MMDAFVCIPWKDSGEPDRHKALDYVTGWWSRNGYPWVTAPSYGAGPFNISAARNAAAELAIAAGAKTLIFADADTIPGTRAQIVEAVYQSRMCPGAIYPHDHYWSLTEDSTRYVFGVDRHADGLGPNLLKLGVEGPPNRTSVSGVVVTTVDSWESAGRWDTGFVGWGNEDVAFALMARDVLGRALRLPGHVFHLWHPRSGYPTFTPPADLERLSRYYEAAVAGPHALRALRSLPEAGFLG